MNRYYYNGKDTTYAVRCNGIKFEAPAGHSRVDATADRRKLASIGVIPTYLPRGGDRLARL